MLRQQNCPVGPCLFVTLRSAPPPGHNGEEGPTTPTAASLSVSSSSLNFGSVQVGQSKSLSLMMSNTVAQPLTVHISQVHTRGAGFKAGAMSLPLMVAAGQSATVTVTFKPPGGGTASGSVSIASNASNPAITVGLSGIGVAQGQLSSFA